MPATICPSVMRCSSDQQESLINTSSRSVCIERKAEEMAFAITFPSVANNGTGETEAVVSHPFLPVPMDKIMSLLGHNALQCDGEPMVGELMFTNPTLTRRVNSREKSLQQRCVILTLRHVNQLIKAENGANTIEQWRFIGSFLNKMGGMYNIIVSRKASLLCPFETLSEQKQSGIATLDTVVLIYKRASTTAAITVRVVLSLIHI